jgi:hypothetical protein
VREHPRLIHDQRRNDMSHAETLMLNPNRLETVRTRQFSGLRDKGQAAAALISDRFVSRSAMAALRRCRTLAGFMWFTGIYPRVAPLRRATLAVLQNAFSVKIVG